MISNENHDVLCFQASATLHETFIFLRKKQGLSSLALQGARKTQIWENVRNFMKIHEMYGNFIKFQKFQENSCFGVPGSEYDCCNH